MTTATKTMKTMSIKNFGKIEDISELDLPIPEPLPNEVQIKISFSGVNPVDWKITEGLLAGRLPHEFPIILGWECSGIISKIGSEVEKLKVGDQVYTYARTSKVKNGTFAEYVCIDAKNVVLKPKSLSFAQAAGIPLTALTAWQCLHEASNVKKGDVVLIHAGAGGVGGMAIQIAHNMGAYVITTARTDKHDYVKKLGADLAIDYAKENFVTAIRHKFPKGVDVVLDFVGGETQEASFAIVKPNGKLVSIVSPPDADHAKKYNVQIGYVFVKPDGEQLKEIAHLFDTGKFVAPHIEVIPLAQAAVALEKVQSGRTRGKIVLEIV